MKGMFRAQLFRFTHSVSLWIILAVLIVCYGGGIVTGAYTSAEVALHVMVQDMMPVLLGCAVYGGLILTDDFSNGMVRRYVASGHKRYSIVLSKYVYYLLGCVVMFVLYLAIPMALTAFTAGIDGSVGSLLSDMGRLLLRALPMYLCGFSLFFLFAMLFQKGVVAMGVSVALTVVSIMLNSKVGPDSIWRFNPIYQFFWIMQDLPLPSDYYVTLALCAVVILAVPVLSMVRIAREEL